ncbi:clustered mitochondria-domain-containing protein [Tribonema minus]|uniref:Clustered mitochondria-domain-containing protein n=1 Tax=Tribonema minus TaxID=303371 RepID=A0A836CKQ1_9STRA|nr:clustered mitochondria-domain-containing protein [Tribonema minus]
MADKRSDEEVAVDPSEDNAGTVTANAEVEEGPVPMDVEEEEEEPATPTLNVLVHPPKGCSAAQAILLQGITPTEMAASVRQLLLEAPEVCYMTSYKLHLLAGGKTVEEINDFVELESLEPVAAALAAAVAQEDAPPPTIEMQMEMEDYTVKKVRDHVKRFKELLMYPPEAADGTVPGDAEASSKARKKLAKTSKAAAAAAGGGKSGAAAEEDQAAEKAQQQQQQQRGGDDPQKAAEEQADALARLKDASIPVGRPQGLAAFYDVALATDISHVPKGAGLGAGSRCLKSLVFGAWNPPPARRRLLGDLVYLEVVTLDDATLHVTATPAGFYVNNTRHATFDPAPAAVPHFSHDLLTCLISASPSFREHWTAVMARAAERAVLPEDPLQTLAVMVRDGKVDAVTTTPQWNVPNTTEGINNPLGPHMADQSRAEEDATSTFGMEERGPLRDWNEELQSDFQEAATLGAQAICQGYVTPINGMESPRSHVYVFNNIFFSNALDTKEGGRAVNGDPMAHKSALHDLHNVKAISMFETPGLHTLAMAVVDYLGRRIVAQSVIPGILQGDSTFKLVYGAVEPSHPLKLDADMHEQLRKLAPKLLIAERTLPAIPMPAAEGEGEEGGKKEKEGGEGEGNGEGQKGEEKAGVEGEGKGEGEKGEEKGDQEVSLCGAVELKGIEGYDARRYIMEVIRLTPRDANWVDGDGSEHKGTGVYTDWLAANAADAKKRADASVKTGGSSYEDRTAALCMAVLRQELVAHFVRSRLVTWQRNRKIELVKAKQEEQQAAVDAAASQAATENGDGEAVSKTAADKHLIFNFNNCRHRSRAQAEADDATIVSLTQEDVAALKAGEAEMFESLRMNVNVFMPYKGCSDAAQLTKDEALVRDAAMYLWETVLPSVTSEVKKGAFSPRDGTHLTSMLHTMGINIRYLGRLATCAAEEEAQDRTSADGKERRWRMPLYWLDLLEMEMAARAVKHVLAALLKAAPAAIAAPAPTLVTLLNCLLGAPPGAGEAAAATPPKQASPLGSPLGVNGHKTTGGGAKGKKGKGGKGGAGGSSGDVAGLAAGAGVPAVPTACAGMTHASLWKLVADEVKDYFRHDLAVLGAPAPQPERAASLRIALLRRICQQLGVRVVSRAYDMSAAEPLTLGDVVDVVPRAKSCLPPNPFPEAATYIEHSRQQLNTGNLQMAFELAQHAGQALQRVCSGMHIDFAAALEAQAIVLHSAGSYHEAAALQAKALAFYAQLRGFDANLAMACHERLAVFYGTAGSHVAALRHMRAYCYLLELSAGPRHPDLSTSYLHLAQMYADVKQPNMSVESLKESLRRENVDRLVEGQAHRALATLMESGKHFKDALHQERSAYSIFKSMLGIDHVQSRQSSQSLSRLAGLAVDATRTQLSIESNRAATARAVAQAGASPAAAAGGSVSGSGKSKKKKKKSGSGASTSASTSATAATADAATAPAATAPAATAPAATATAEGAQS